MLVIWRYKVVPTQGMKDHEIETFLNAMGAKGWQFCYVLRRNYFFKRPFENRERL